MKVTIYPSLGPAKLRHVVPPAYRELAAELSGAADGDYSVVEGLEIDPFSQERINLTLKELLEEQEGVKHLL